MPTMYKWNVYVKGTCEKLGYVWAWWDGSALNIASDEYDYPTSYIFVVRADQDKKEMFA